jgi:hypothetical protein
LAGLGFFVDTPDVGAAAFTASAGLCPAAAPPCAESLREEIATRKKKKKRRKKRKSALSVRAIREKTSILCAIDFDLKEEILRLYTTPARRLNKPR